MGLFIAIEGGDGSGKGTHSKLLVQWLRDQGHDVFETDFPRYGQDSAYYVERYLNGAYGGPNDVPAELGILPFALDRYAAKHDILEHLEKDNAIVVSNRYMASNLAHQGTKIADSEQRKAFYERTETTEFGVLGIPRPHKNIVLIMPSSHMQANVDKKETRTYTGMKRDIHEADADHLEKAKVNFEELCELYPDEYTSIQCVDTSGSMRAIDDIQQDIRTLIGSSLRR